MKNLDFRQLAHFANGNPTDVCFVITCANVNVLGYPALSVPEFEQKRG